MKRKRFNEGGMPDFEREPLRDSSGNIVTDSSGQPIMSGSTPGRTRAANIPPERMSTLDPSDIEDAIRGRMMTAAQNEPVKSPVRSEYDTESGLDYSPGMGSRISVAKPPVRPVSKSPMPARPTSKPPMSVGPAPMPPMSAGPAPKPPMSAGPAPEAKPAKKANVYEDRAEMMRGAGKKVRDFFSRMSKGHEFTGDGRESGRKKGGAIGMKTGGSVSSASKRADGIAMRGKTRGKYI